MFLGPLHQSSGLLFKKGMFWDVFRPWGPHLGMPVTTHFWGAQPPFFAIPSSAFKFPLWAVLLRSFKQSLMRWSELPHLKQFQFFLCYSSTALAKWWYRWPADLVHESHSRFRGLLQLKTQPLLFFPFWLYTRVPFSSNAFHYGRLSCEGMIALQLPRGKQIPQCLWLHNIWSSQFGGLQEQGISGFGPSFQLPGCKEQVGVASGVFAIHFVDQHALIFWVQTLTEMISFHPL